MSQQDQDDARERAERIRKIQEDNAKAIEAAAKAAELEARGGAN